MNSKIYENWDVMNIKEYILGMKIMYLYKVVKIIRGCKIVVIIFFIFDNFFWYLYNDILCVDY